MSLDQHIEVTLVVNNQGVAQESFGTMAFLSYTSLWSDPSRSYTRKSEAVADGFASDGPEVAFLNAVFSQSPRPSFAKIIRGTRPPTIHYTVSASAVSSKLYSLAVAGQGVTARDATYTSDSSATVAEIHNGLVTDLNLVAGRNFTAAFAPLTFVNFNFTVPDHTNDLAHAVAHGRQTGDGPVQLTNVGGALPAGLLPAHNYWLIRSGPDDLKFADSLALALAGTPIDITGAGTGTHTVAVQGGTVSPAAPFGVVGNAAGAWFTLASANTSILSLTQDHADPGIALDLDEAQIGDPDWYWLCTTANSELMGKAAANWVEGEGKVYIVDFVDSACENTASGSGDVLDDIKGFGYKRTVHSYKRTPAQMTSAGWTGALAALPVGTWTAAYKAIAGSSPDKFTRTQTNNLDAKRASYYKSEAQRPFAWQGQVGSMTNGFLDVTVSLDFILDLIKKRAFGLLVSLPALHITDEDIAMMRGTIQGAIDDCTGKDSAHPIVATGTPGDPNDPVPRVTFPRVKDIAPSDRSLRKLPDGQIFFRMQSAFHTVAVELTVTF